MEISKKNKRKDAAIVGFALFSMFFGAGNVIFPPYLGMSSGPDWIVAFGSYFLSDIGLALIAIVAMLRSGRNMEQMMGQVGKTPGVIITSAIILCIGPLLAIPRTGATTYELGIAPLFGGVSPIVVSIVFFAIILTLSIKESAVVDIVGKFLTPALFVGLLALIVVGIVKPLGPLSAVSQVENPISNGISSGYQTMDVLAALVFGIILVKSVEGKGYADKKTQSQIIKGASQIAAIGLVVVYCGLTYLGATTSTIYTLEMDRSALIIAITQGLMGKAGVVLLGVIITLACITTAVALTSACADYFSKLSKGRLSYRAIAVIVCVFSAVMANFGLEQIISIAAPILSLLYPGALTLIFLSCYPDKYTNTYVHKSAVIGATFISFLEILYSYGLPLDFVTELPFAAYGFGWVIPALVCGVIGSHIKGSEDSESEEKKASPNKELLTQTQK